MRAIIYGAFDAEQNKVIFKSANYKKVEDFIKKSNSELVLTYKFKSF